MVFAERCARCHSSKLPPLPPGLDLENANGPGYLTAWDTLLGMDEDRRLQVGDAAAGGAGRFPGGQLPLDRAARADHAARDQRLQPDRDQRDSRQHLGQLLVRVVQDRCRRWARSRSAIRSAAWRWTIRCRPAAAATSGRRRSSACGRPRRSSRTTPSGRSSGARRSKRGCDRSTRRSSRCCGPRSATRIRSSPSRPGPASASSTA